MEEEKKVDMRRRIVVSRKGKGLRKEDGAEEVEDKEERGGRKRE
jgi:hypothetical protein